MNRIAIIAIVAAVGLLTVHGVDAKKKEDYTSIGSSQKLNVNVELWTQNKKKMGDTLVWVKYKNIVQSKHVDFMGKKKAEVSFLFPPLNRGLFFLDWYTVCAKNEKTEEKSCVTDYRFGDGKQESYLQVFNTR